LLNHINLGYTSNLSLWRIIFLLSKINTMLAHSKTDLLAIFKKFAKSLSENEPLPSAMLFEILKAADLSCSAKFEESFQICFLSIIEKFI